MLKETIKYTDYDGNEQTEDFYFNISRAQFIEMEVNEVGGVVGMLRRVGSARDPKVIMKFMKDFIRKSYGIKSDDGKKFVKNDSISDDFENTEAYSELYCRLCTDAKYAIHFIIKVLPLDEKERGDLLNRLDKIDIDNLPDDVTEEEIAAKIQEIPSETK